MSAEGTEKQIRNKTLRKALIMNLLDEYSILKVTELSKEVGVSVVTIRSDLEELEREGRIRKTHGSATINRNTKYSDSFEDRKRFKAIEKRKIAKAAAALINDGDSLIINVGSTCSFITTELRAKRNLIIVTNALHVMNAFADDNNNTLIFLGGHFDNSDQTTVGDDVTNQLSKYKVSKLIMGMDGIDPVAGATSSDYVGYSVTKQMLSQASEKILVADDSKIGKVSLAHIADLNAFDVLITNYSPSNEDLIHEIEAIGLKVIVV